MDHVVRLEVGRVTFGEFERCDGGVVPLDSPLEHGMEVDPRDAALRVQGFLHGDGPPPDVLILHEFEEPLQEGRPVRGGEVAVPCPDRRLGGEAEALLGSRSARQSGGRGRCEGCYGGRELRDAVRGELARELLPKLLRVLLRRLSGDLRELGVWEPQSRKTG